MEQINRILFSVFAVGGSNIKQTLTETQAAGSLYDILINISMAVGVIVTAVAIMKLIMSFADENAKGQADAAFMLAGGIFFLCMSGVVSMLKINDTTTLDIKTVVRGILSVLQNFFVYAGLTLAILSIFMLITSVMQERSDQQEKATTMLGVSIGLLSAKVLVKAIRDAYMSNGGISSKEAVNIALDFIIGVASYIGGGFLIYGSLRIVMGIKSEDGKERDNGIKLAAVGVALIAFRVVLAMFNLRTH